MIFRRNVDELATKTISRYLAWRWDRVSGRTGPSEPASAAQRPHFHFHGLTARPWWDPTGFPWVGRLEQEFDTLHRELDNLLSDGFLRPAPIETIPVRKRDLDQRLVQSGAWHLYRLFYNGYQLTENCRRCPQTARLFREIPNQWGTVGFGVMEPGTHIAPHCGPTNAKLRCHLGLEVPDGCRIRVSDETRMWVAGKCLIFDDSFEHEVWNMGSSPRYIFMVDVHHPDLILREQQWIERMSARLIKLAPRHMKKALEMEPRFTPAVAASETFLPRAPR